MTYSTKLKHRVSRTKEMPEVVYLWNFTLWRKENIAEKTAIYEVMGTNEEIFRGHIGYLLVNGRTLRWISKSVKHSISADDIKRELTKKGLLLLPHPKRSGIRKD